MRIVDIYNSTPVIEAVITFKGWRFKTHSEKPPAFPYTEAPVMFTEGYWISGVYPIVLYLDRRVPYPPLFPTEHEDCAKAAMIFGELLIHQPQPEDWLPILEDRAFVFGDVPCIVDLLLANTACNDPHWLTYRDRVYGFVRRNAA